MIGDFIGWCTHCGRDTFDGVRHTCPRRIMPPIRILIAASRALVEDMDNPEARERFKEAVDRLRNG